MEFINLKVGNYFRRETSSPTIDCFGPAVLYKKTSDTQALNLILGLPEIISFNSVVHPIRFGLHHMLVSIAESIS